MWTKEQINNHLIACKLLDKIKDNVFNFIRENKTTDEKQVQDFIIKQYKKYNLVSSKDGPPIVAFNQSSATPHYFVKKPRKLKQNTLILIDIWARLKKKNSPFSDITWIAYYGKIPKQIQKTFNIILLSRDSCLNFIKKQLKKKQIPQGIEADFVSKNIIMKAGFERNILHGTGHSIGFISPHGPPKHLNSKGDSKLKLNLGYTIEPGIYFKNKFGIRSEIDFYINKNYKLIVTTKMQKKIVNI